MDIHEHQTGTDPILQNNSCLGIRTVEGSEFHAGKTLICAGPNTSLIIPELQAFIKSTGHPVFHIRSENAHLFAPPNFAVFGADISKTGWYGFPQHPLEGVIKIANHGAGLELHPENDERFVTKTDISDLRKFLSLIRGPLQISN